MILETGKRGILMNILICDDYREIVNAIEVYLKNEGYDIFKAYDGLEALDVIEKNEIHLIIMDIMMPKLDGMRTTMKIREEKNIPIIMLSAKSEDYDKITGLNIGADDYITKPFNPLELIARVKSQLRRYVNLGSMEKKTGTFKTGGLEVDDEQKTVTLDGEQVVLTPIEYGILKLLTENAGKVFSIDQIYEAVWHEPAISPENTVAVHIRRIREKIEINPKEPKYLKVVWGIGYKIEKIK
jgi:DNA-binding response OmpR family regulator